LLTDTSPRICKPYFQVQSALAPHVAPYYDAYAASYVDAARPYYNTLDKRAITPVTVLSKKYGAPRVAQAQAFGQAQWDKNVQPEVSKYQAILKKQYDQTLGPHIDAAMTSANPYYNIAKNSALQTYYEHILPAYTAVQPYALQGYGLASDFTANTAIPYSKWAWTTGVVFLDRTVWPKLRILYGENVEPQLVRIGERLGRYRDGKKIKAVVDEVDRLVYHAFHITSRALANASNSSSSAQSASQTFSSISSSIASAHETSIPSTSAPQSTVVASEAAAHTPESEKEIREKAQKVVAHDLRTWQEKFAKAADEGSDDLEERITEITDRLIHNQAEKVGKAHIIELEETIKSGLDTLQRNIISIVKDAKDDGEAENALNAAVRKAGVAIKEKAQSIRSWRQSYDQETNSLVSKAAMDTLEILDHIRDLGLQEIGMRWAWIDGVTHKDWAKYHQLKTKFDEWRYDVEKTAVEHPGLEKARSASDEVESQAMAIAEDAAKELARLKETGRWKISAKDTTDNFSTKVMPAAAVVAGQKVLEKVSELSEAIAPSSQSTLESVSSSIAEGLSAASSVVASQVDNVQSVVSSLSRDVVATPQASVESIVSAGTSSVSSLVDQTSSSILGTQQGSVESLASAVKESATSLVEQASSSVIGTSQGSVEFIVSVASKSASSLSADASSAILGEESNKLSKSISDASTAVSSAVSIASSAASQKVWGGAMAQHVEARQIIWEDVIDSDDDTFSEKLQSMASQAGDKYADISKAVSEALVGATSTEEFPVTKLAAGKFSSALSAASVALYGTEQGTGESLSSVVSSRYADAVAA
jgi:hypothetical protein